MVGWGWRRHSRGKNLRFLLQDFSWVSFFLLPLRPQGIYCLWPQKISAYIKKFVNECGWNDWREDKKSFICIRDGKWGEGWILCSKKRFDHRRKKLQIVRWGCHFKPRYVPTQHRKLTAWRNFQDSEHDLSQSNVSCPLNNTKKVSHGVNWMEQTQQWSSTFFYLLKKYVACTIRGRYD